ncbi:preprotein translocase subunit SecG [soil metagenome]
METVVIVIHLMVIIALVAVVLLQKSEGGALGVGGSNQFMTTRGQGNVLTRTTTILAAIFFATSLAMSVLSRLQAPPSSILDQVPPAAQTNAPATPPVAGAPAAPATGAGSGTGSGQGILDELNRFTQGAGGAANPSTTAPGTSTAPIVPPAAQPANPAAPPAGTTTPLQVPTTQ